MPKIYESDISSINTFISNTLSNEVEDTQRLIIEIKSFIDDSKSILTGEVWNRERTVFEKYINILEQRKQVADSIINASISASNIMSNYMGSDSMIDDSKLEELLLTRNNYMTLKQEYEANSTGDSDKNSIVYYQNLIDEADKHIKKLEDLVPTDNTAYAHYQKIDSVISAFNNNVLN